ncbi:serine acetyltransferase [Candidatus Methylacidiphilum fumarolicum]|uniref:Serine acetyltransferase n=2 Tax=Candidatus Methylacidiphilum fumarolicum TaxID=591154 RepID=I0K1C4_METFB|nr:serine O-acetyltransferase EpsC [Candidatus Methylacidiphilum fumarolicum]MBW6414951.1 serine O-acetyltransferase [Candidatus Methylacidiphilum fumarolicum]TFE70359.1 serine acetyltransferase [Candidatus Methylacidiphilum fumarolicum]TFE73961.1 serine acetyltransferase [Candidatus Methylacidiphilum fumarolicum]TFE74467.1 serine acetyltransferase [Candidatus Methylacidiphilum fumarolicum]TFE77872.1 serine acetyltransferase [Candidatus Methylacidiphilum fumarolicum]
MEKFSFNLILEELLTSYKIHGGINCADGKNLPSKKAVSKLTEDLLSLIFPGFYISLSLSQDKVGSFCLEVLKRVYQALLEELEKSLLFSPIKDQTAESICQRFLSKLPEIRKILATDLKATYEGDPASASIEEVLLAYPGIEAIAVYRLAHVLYQENVALIPRMMTEWAHARTGIDIHPGAEIGSDFFIDHGTGIVIGETCKIGHHVKIYHGVTLGARSTKGGRRLRGQKRHPTIEDYVTIYPGATILGGETVIGAGSIIGGNVWLTHPVAPNSIVTLVDQEIRVRTKNE